MQIKQSTLRELKANVLNKIVAFKQNGKFFSSWCLVLGMTVKLDATGEVETACLNLQSVDAEMRKNLYIGDTPIKNVFTFEEVCDKEMKLTPIISDINRLEDVPESADALISEFETLMALVDAYPLSQLVEAKHVSTTV